MKKVNLAHNAESPSAMPELSTSVVIFDGITECCHIIAPLLPNLSNLSTALKHSDMCSCGCSMVKSKAIGGQESLAPSEPNPTAKRAVINYGDKQHFVGMEPEKRGSFSSVESLKEVFNMKAHEKIQKQGARAYHSGVAKSRNPWQYSSDKIKQAAWSAGWNRELQKKIKLLEGMTQSPAKPL